MLFEKESVIGGGIFLTGMVVAIAAAAVAREAAQWRHFVPALASYYRGESKYRWILFS